MPAAERAELVQELLELIKGKVMVIALKHDASRVVQTALQFGNREVRPAKPALVFHYFFSPWLCLVCANAHCFYRSRCTLIHSGLIAAYFPEWVKRVHAPSTPWATVGVDTLLALPCCVVSNIGVTPCVLAWRYHKMLSGFFQGTDRSQDAGYQPEEL